MYLGILYEEIGKYEKSLENYNRLLTGINKLDESNPLFTLAKNRRERLLFKMFPPPPTPPIVDENLIFLPNIKFLSENSMLFYKGHSSRGDEAGDIFICKNNNKPVNQVEYVNYYNASDSWEEKYIFYCNGLDFYWIYWAGSGVGTRLYGPFENLTLEAN